ncbi:MAG: gamma-glutamyltransferase [Acidobacteria bacterium]|nr:gamma-glutamyltransferase [Acidobacteriota bacterium]
MHRITRRSLLGAAAALQSAIAARISAEGRSVSGTLGIVVTEQPDAAKAGARMLESGGNAFDAAAAASIAACMLEPQSVDIGGYVCAAVIREGKSGKIFSLDSNSVAPAAAHDKMYTVLPRRTDLRDTNENEYFCSVKDNANVTGPLAVGVPGVMAGIGTMWERWGRARWPSVLEASLTLLDRGFPYRGAAGAIRNRESVIRALDASQRHLMPLGKLPTATDVWHRRDMDKTLLRISREGWKDFYQGELAHRIADYVQRAGGILTRQDMAKFQPRITPAYSTQYRNARVHGAILANGGISALEILNMLECFSPAPADSVTHYHRWIEVLKLAWRDRLRYLGDPDHARVPVERLLSKDYAAGRIETLRALPESVDRFPAPSAQPSTGTVHLTAADAEGNMVAVTISHGGGLGSCVTVPDTGIILGHGMCRFDPRPGRPNSVAAFKRPLNNVCPSIVETPERTIACGMRGGRRIISVVAHMCQRLVDFHDSPEAAVDAPRFHVEEQEPAEVSAKVPEPVVAELQRMGHNIKSGQPVGGACSAIEIVHNARQLRGAGSTFAVAVS